MEEILIKLETAKLAKEKGFNIPVDKFYNESLQGLGWRDFNENQSKRDFNNSNTDYSASTQSLLQKWLRDVHQIDISIKVGLLDNVSKVYIYSIPFHETLINWNKYKTYEDALEAGLKEGLNLITNNKKE
jgi:hypothetical protein